MSTIVVSGINGFVGKHVLNELVAQNHTVIGLGREPKPDQIVLDKSDRYYSCDITDPAAVAKLPLEDFDAIINLAGMTHVSQSFAEADKYMDINVKVLTVIGEEIIKRKLSTRILAVSSGTIYDPAQPMPLTEASRLTTVGSPYALSKIAMEKAAEPLREQSLDCVVVRPFNHIGPGQLPGFIVPDFYHGLVEAVKSNQPLSVGNIKSKRDYTDVRDVVKAYALLATAPREQLKSSLYNICSGQSRSGEEILAALKPHVPGSEAVEVTIDPNRVRPNDPADLYGSHNQLTSDTGWQPSISFEQTIADFVAAQ